MFNEGLKQENYGKTLNALAVPLERKPRPVRFVAQYNLCFRQKVPRLQRHHSEINGAFPVARRNARGSGERLGDLT
jgi:hypothetical protein